jgi:YtxH-like protein
MNKLLKSVLRTAMFFLEQSDRVASDMRDRVDRAADRVSDLRDQAQDLYTGGEDHTLRNVLTFAAGVGVGIGAGMLFAPASGEEIRGQIGDKVHDIGDRVRSRFSSEVSSRKVRKTATGTEGR